MFYAMIPLVAVIVLMGLGRIVLRVSAKQRDAEDSSEFPLIIKQPKSEFLIGVFVALCMPLSIAIILIFDPGSFTREYPIATISMVSVISLVVIFGGIYWILRGRNWKIEVHEDRFVYTNLFKKSKEYYFKQIKIKYFNSCYRVYENRKGMKPKHLFGVSYMQENQQALTKANTQFRKSKKKGRVQVDAED
ncbi:MAG: hypothetical protein FWE38_05570 [Firmicutes bacterium]|nr:hypothetical protein [Bacillota bacterium]